MQYIMVEISIIVPVYNSERYIEKCIQSLRNQSFNKIEIIIIDDGSSDNSFSICMREAEKDNRIKVISQNNLGVSEARNKGIDIAQGKYIMFCDSDDFVESTWCEDLYNKIENNRYSFIVSGYSIINLRNNNSSIINKTYDKNKLISRINKCEFWNLYKKNLSNPPFNKIYLLEKIKENDIKFDINLSLGEDLLFNLEYMKYTEDIIIVNKQLYNYIQRDNESLDNRYYENLFEIYNKLYNSMYEYMKKFNVDLRKEEKNFYRSYLYMLMRVLNNTLSKKNRMCFKDKIKYNSKLLKSSEFKKCINKADLSEFNNYYIKLLKDGNYMKIYIVNKLLIIKQKLYSIKNK